MEEQRNPRKRRSLAAILIMLSAIALSATVTRLHGTPAILSGAAGGILLVMGIVLFGEEGLVPFQRLEINEQFTEARMVEARCCQTIWQNQLERY